MPDGLRPVPVSSPGWEVFEGSEDACLALASERGVPLLERQAADTAKSRTLARYQVGGGRGFLFEHMPGMWRLSLSPSHIWDNKEGT